MKPLPAVPEPRGEPHQLSMPLDAPKLRGLSPSERSEVLGELAQLLLEAVEGSDHACA